jgi:PTH1 family peptidyl-tRNA hydrolase
LDDLLSRRNFDDLEPPSLVIVGLGNPGDKYTRTRHNAGFWFIDRLAKKHSITLERRHQSALIGEGVIGDDSVVLVKPRTFVNRSGEAVRYLLARYRIKPDKLLIVYDEINLPPGKLRLRPGGSAGGHNGIRSIIESAGTQEFPRLRIGVGRQEDGDSQIDHVLGKLPPDEQKAVDDAIERGVDAVSNLLTEGIDRAMNKFN